MEELTINDYLVIFRQRRKAFFFTFAIAFLLSIVASLAWSNYRSSTTIEIQQPQVSTEITTPLGMNPSDMPEALADLRVNRINQKVTSQSSLIDIITKYNLYSGARSSHTIADVADKMASKIKLKLISSEIANPNATQKVSATDLSAIAFTLSFDYSDPEIAQKITNELATRFMDEDLKDRRTQAETTSEFIQKQIEMLEKSMAEQEKNIADFEAKNGVSRPEVLMFNQQAAENTSMSMQNIDTQIASNEGTQGSLRSQLATVEPYTRVIADGQVLTTPATQLKALKAQYATLTAQYGPEHPDVVKLKHQIESLETSNGGSGGHSAETSTLKTEIADVTTNLKAAKKNYGPKHPDVISLQRQLDDLKSKLASAQAENNLKGNLHQDADNPAYIGLVSQLQATEEQHKSLITQREKLNDQMLKYQHAVTQNPLLQQQMATLTRDYDNAQLRYRDLKIKKMAADMDVQMIEDHHGERLTIISPPDLPQHTHPRQILIVVAGFVFSVMAGIFAVILKQLTANSIFGSRQLASLVGVAPLVTIPYLPATGEKKGWLAKRTAIASQSSFAAQLSSFADRQG